MKYFICFVLFLTVPSNSWCQPGSVLSIATVRHDSIDTPVQAGVFGISVSSIGDLNNDGVEDLVVGAMNVGPISNRGTIYVLFMDSSGAVKSTTKIASGLSGFSQQTGFDGRFGESLANLGDVNGDGTTEVAVGNPFNNGQGSNEGAVWILSIKSDGTVGGSVKIGEGSGGFSGNLENDERFGSCLSVLPDADNDGIPELLVGAPYRNIGATNDAGRVYLLRLNSNGTVKNQSIYDGSLPLLNFSGSVRFGSALGYTNDLDSNGIPEIVTGVTGDNVMNGKSRGSIAILFLDTMYNLTSVSIINDKSANFPSTADSVGRYGSSIASMGDLDGDGYDELMIGALEGQINPASTNLILTLYLNSQGTLKTSNILTASSGMPFAPFSNPGGDFAGAALAVLNDIDGDGKRDLIAGAPAFNNGNGQIHILTLDGISHIGLEEKPIEPHLISVFPNPSTGLLNIELSEEFSNQRVHVVLLDVVGRKLMEKEFETLSTDALKINLNQPPGVYYLHCKAKDLEDVKKVIIRD